MSETGSRAQGGSPARSECATALLRSALESTADGILIVDPDGKIVAYNALFVRMWRIPDDVIASRSDERVLAFVLDQVADPGHFLTKVRDLYARHDAAAFDTIAFKDGRVFERYSQPQRLAGEYVGRVWSYRDVSERRRLEETASQTQKLEALGLLAGGIAHDFNNLLQVVSGYAARAAAPLPDGHPSRECLDRVLDAAERAAGLTRGLLAFSRRQVLQVRAIDLNEVVTTFSRMLGGMMGEGIEITVRRVSGPLVVRADPSQIDQVLLHLCSNAKYAMPRGGRLVIETRRVDVEEEIATSHGSASAGAYAVLSVVDTGVGMDDRTKRRLFEPFFSTRAQGSGLGLATVHGVAHQHGGFVDVRSTPAEGSAFHVYLPLGPAEGPERPAPPPVSEVEGDETILVAEDEPMLRDLMESGLADQGYLVVLAEDGETALRRFTESPDAIDCVVLDVVMPNLGGPEALIRMRAIRPDLPAILISGYAPDVTQVTELLRSQGVPFLPKPFTTTALAKAIRQTILRARAPREGSA
jgi:two-component system cell cycle sensor histidine kinase/response regulator CckA